MPVLKVSKEIIQEITGGRKIQAPTYLALNKKLITDITNTKKLQIVSTCTKVINYYNRVVYPITSLSTQYFRLDIEYILVLFRIIQSMKMCLYILFRVSKQFCTRGNC